MREATPLKLGLFIAGSITIICGIISIFIHADIVYRAVTCVAIGICSFLLVTIGVKMYIINRVEEINTMIFDSIRNERFKSKMENAGSDPLNKLNNSVKRLIKEKTIEIDNLKDLERMRKEFLGDVAHELRSPIFNIQGYIHTLIEGAWEDEEVSEKFLRKAAKHVDHLSSLVEDLVTITRIEAGEMKLERIEFDIKELVHEVTELLDLPAKQKGISLCMKFTLDEPIMVNADRPKIRQVLMNLVGNSIKYGRVDGTTSISIHDDSMTSINVEVTDNGEGIAQEHLPRIFERFYRVDKSRKRTESSTGLGLAIVKHFIEAHKQKIHVTSHEGVGSIFSFTLDKATLIY